MDITGHEDPVVDALDLVCEWLGDPDHGPWLFVLDNADNMDMFFSPRSKSSPSSTHGIDSSKLLVDFVPRSANGSVLITSRDTRVGDRMSRRGKTIMVMPMDKQDANELLLVSLPSLRTLELGESKELLDGLEYLPLAITQAAAFITENDITLSDYLNIFNSDDSELVDLLSTDHSDQRRDSDIQNSIVRTWKISFDQISKQQPRAAELLSLMSVLDRQEIPKMLIQESAEKLIEFTKALGTLKSFSLISSQVDRETYSMHRLVQISMQNWLEMHGTRQQWYLKALDILDDRFSVAVDWDTINEGKALHPHAQVIITHFSKAEPLSLEYASLLTKLGFYDDFQGHYHSALSKMEKSLSIVEEVRGRDSSNAIVSMWNVARELRSLCRFNEALKLCQTALQRFEVDEVDGDEEGEEEGERQHNKIRGMQLLGALYADLEQNEAAEDIHRKALEASRRELGQDSPVTINSMSLLSVTLMSLKKCDEAESLLRHTAELLERTKGKAHPATLTTLSRLSDVLDGRGMYREAESMIRQEIDLYGDLFGEMHPKTLASRIDMARNFFEQKRYDESEVLFKETLEQSMNILGKNHFYTHIIIHNLSTLQREKGNYEQATILAEQALSGYHKSIGPKHPKALSCTHELAYQYRLQHNFVKAETLYRETLELEEEVLGENNLNTLATLWNLALLYKDIGQYEKAIELFETYQERSANTLGLDDMATIECRNVLKNLRQQSKGQMDLPVRESV